MNLAESMKTVLKSRSHQIFSDVWRDDLKLILSDIKGDVADLLKSGASSFKSLKGRNFKENLAEMADSAADAFLIFKIMPRRVKEGFQFFRNDLVEELENLSDQKQKTIFCLKVFGALASFMVGSFYGFKKGTSDISLKGLKRKNAFTQFIIAEIIFKVSQLFLKRFITEVEQLVDDPEELKNLRYFKELISDRAQLEAEAAKGSAAQDGDRAIQLVDELKAFISTGKRK